MDKIGILTFHDTTNFGAILQAVATYKAINGLGKECEILNYHCKNIDDRELPKWEFDIKQLGLKPIVRFIVSKKKHRVLINFLQKETRVSEYYDRNTVYKAARKYEKFVVGSDMVWCTAITKSDYTYMLDFVKDNSKKYAFASSIGYDWDKKEEKEIMYFLDQFEMIAVREKYTGDVLSSMMGRKIWNVCDPTMLIQPEIWKTYAKKIRHRRPYSFIYMNDAEGNCQKAALKYGEENRMSTYKLGLINKYGKKIKVKKVHTISEFLGYIMESKILFTASYHGMLFAIYFHVPFVFFNNSVRLMNLAAKLGLSGRNGNLYEVSKMERINWKSVDAIRNEFAEYSIGVLIEMLERESERQEI